jgi:16S rRNA (cytidine1402-2'-O)-methyltransferase
MLGREMTKAHQEFLRGTAGEVVEALGEPRGEFTVVVGPAVKVPSSKNLAVTDADVVREFWRLTETAQVSRREAVRLVAQGSGRSSKEVYSVIERAKNWANNK